MACSPQSLATRCLGSAWLLAGLLVAPAVTATAAEGPAAVGAAADPATSDTYEAELASRVEAVSPAWWAALRAAAAAAWDYELTSVDDRPVTVRKIAGGLILLAAGYLLSRLLSRIIGRRVLPRLGLDEGVSTALQTIAFYVLLATFGLFSLELINIPLTVFACLGGAVAIGVGFGSQNVINNFISGLILLAERSVRVGDLIEVEGVYGNVEDIGARSTRVRTGSNLEIIVPNSRLLENKVANLTLSDSRRRTSVAVGVAYGAPTRAVERLLRESVVRQPEVLASPEPIVLFKEFGDNALLFEVHFWVQLRTMMQSYRVESNVRFAVDEAFREAGISIAFPQRDIHLDTLRPLEVNVRSVGQDDERATVRLFRRPAA